MLGDALSDAHAALTLDVQDVYPDELARMPLALVCEVQDVLHRLEQVRIRVDRWQVHGVHVG